MKRVIIAAFAVLLGLGAIAFAQTKIIQYPSSGPGTGCTTICSMTSLAIDGASIGTNSFALNGTSAFGGQAVFSAGTSSAPGIAINSSNYGFYYSGGAIFSSINGNIVLGYGTGAFVFGSGLALDWSSTTSATGTPDTSLTRVSAGVIGMPNITADTALTDASLCEDTTHHGIYYGTGAAGICLGTSSVRFKHDVRPLNAGLDQVMKLEPVSYKLNADHGNPDKTLYGFTAEQGEHALPQLVGRDTEGRPNTFDYMGVVPVAVNAIKQIATEDKVRDDKIAHLEQEIAALKSGHPANDNPSCRLAVMGRCWW